MYRRYLKPLIDFFIALLACFFLLPVFLLIALLLFIANRDNPFFFQLRPGKNGKLFRIIKFKTMNDKTDSSGKLLPDAERLTPIGRIVRKTSLDEIPQLINVLIGDMSLIGPRPLLPEYLPLYNKEQLRRHEAKPGITGWAQVNGRNFVNWDQKFTLDVWYVDHISFSLDFRILLMTFLKVVKSEGISAKGHPTMPTFTEYLKQKKTYE
ncbi:sugar transferase [Salinimicrobium oceani]|uniref:Sugar transferase n=1 Tax=Salinimicrobium oceani TaxID=2722702 RepID=A0ABX1CYT2_9FLAO|nr:sugar transferase [Salinimicrobium oceani]NJW53420.1 sugar transferase [Salinimicrobium oceani]